MKKHWELAFKSAWDLRKLILNKEVSPVNLIEDALLRLNEINPKLNAFLEDKEGFGGVEGIHFTSFVLQ